MKKIALGIALMSLCFLSLAVAEDEKKEGIRCHSDQDCQSPGMIGTCHNPGKEDSACLFQEMIKVNGIVITPKKCRTCNTEYVVKTLQTLFAGLNIEHLDAQSERAKKLIEDLKIEILPAYILSKEVEKEPSFTRFGQMADLLGDQYYMRPAFTGVSYFLDRPLEPHRLDLFLVLTHKDANHLIGIVRELSEQRKDQLKLHIQLIGFKDPETGELTIPAGRREMAEDKLYVCIDEYYPKEAWNYLACRTKDIDSLWWDDCLVENKLDVNKIKQCAKSDEATKLLEKRTKLSEELRITYGPLFLLENIEVFGASPQTTAADIIRVMDLKKE